MSAEIFIRNYSSLSLKDLLEAREAYHVHLMKLESVVATAIGRSRMHFQDPCAKNPERRLPYGKTLPRTMANSIVKPWSWPCVLVFVDTWYSYEELKRNPTQAIPRWLYLSDGRTVPTCVILAPPAGDEYLPYERPSFPSEIIGGGYPCWVRSQGREQFGTIGALVTREGSTFALTNRHVAGRTGQEIYAYVKGDPEKIGISDPVHVGKKPFQGVYPGWQGEHTLVNMDAGLILIEDVAEWTSQVFGIGEVGPLADMNVHTISLDLIGTPVRAFGSASGPSEGEIQGLFYRYCSKGGIDYVADLLIGPRTDTLIDKAKKKPAPGKEKPQLNIHPGDSGTLIFLDPPKHPRRKGEPVPERAESKRARRLRPIAMLWGGVRLKSEGEQRPGQFALGTFLSTICRELDVDLINDWNTGYREYWGKSVHFKIGFKFVELLSNQNLSDVILANRERIGFSDDLIGQGEEFSVGRGKFVPLADVPDYVWVGMAKSGRGSRANELFQHFADMDEEGPNASSSLFELCRHDPDGNLRASAWQNYYNQFKGQNGGPEPGMLPFRVLQIYKAMVDYLSQDLMMEFVGAAGILAHYVADSCIPLHLSFLHHGYNAPPRRDKEKYEKFRKTREYKIHSLFEQRMFEVRAAEMIKKINAKLEGPNVQPTVTGNKQAIRLIFDLMDATFRLLPPEKIIASDDPEETQKERAEKLFREVGDLAAECVAKGCRALAELVESAWKEGDGDNALTRTGVQTYTESNIQRLYRNPNFLPALNFDGLIALGF